MVAVRPAFLNAFLNAGASNCCHRTDVVVSGSSTHTCVAAGRAVAPVAAIATATAARARVPPIATHLRLNLLTTFLPCRGVACVGTLTRNAARSIAALHSQASALYV